MHEPSDDPPARTASQAHSLLLSDACFRMLIEAIDGYAILMLDTSGTVVSWNAGSQKLKGYRADEIIGGNFSVFYTPEDRAQQKPAAMLDKAMTEESSESVGWRLHQDGSRFWANVTITAIRDPSGALIGFGEVTRDLTERKRLAELEHISAMSASIEAARDDEQTRIARELHDDLGQQLTALKMALASLEERMMSEHSSGRRFEFDTGDMRRLLDLTMDSVRRIASGLRAVPLETLGLQSALEWLIEDFAKRYSIEVAAHIELSDVDLTDAAQNSIFRIVQEALTNVAKHAHATHVDVELARAGKTCVLRIEDNGRTASSGIPPGPASFGLLGMRERVHRLHGTISIENGMDEGFRINIVLPLL